VFKLKVAESAKENWNGTTGIKFFVIQHLWEVREIRNLTYENKCLVDQSGKFVTCKKLTYTCDIQKNKCNVLHYHLLYQYQMSIIFMLQMIESVWKANEINFSAEIWGIQSKVEVADQACVCSKSNTYFC
jgi:hypothetical protein